MTSAALGLKYIVWGLIFLMNPNVNIVDVMPDFIGYLLIMRGLYAISAIYPHFRDAFTNFKYLTILSVAKTLALPVLFMISSTEISWLLLLAFAFGCLEIYYGIVAFSRLFEGIYYSAERGAGKAVFDGYDTIRTFTIIFAIFKPIASFLPEITTLSSSEYGTVTDTGIVSYAQFRVPLIILIMIISLTVGIVWYVMARKYFRRLLSDSDYVSSLWEKYSRFSVESPHMIDRRIVLSGVTLFSAAALLALEIKLDGVNYIPNFVAGAFFIAGFLRVRKIFSRLARIGTVLGSVYTAASVASWAFSVFFTSKYIVINKNQIGMAVGYGEQIASYLGTSAEVAQSYTVLCALNALENLLFAALLVSVGYMLKAALMRHGGKHIYELGQVHDRKVILRSTAVERFWIGLTVTVGFVSATLAFLQISLVTAGTNLWIIDIAVRLTWVIMFIHTTDRITESSKEKYIFIKTEGID